MHSLRFALPLALASAIGTLADPTLEMEAETTAQAPACTATSSTGSGAFFDLRPDTAMAVGASAASHRTPTSDYHARGHDYGKNFTLNVCAPVVEPVQHVVGLDEGLWANVSAYYTDGDETFSIGTSSQNLVSRGRKLVLQYVDGSPCGSKGSSKSRRGEPEADEGEHNIWTEDDEDHPMRPAYDPDDSVYHDDADDAEKQKSTDNTRRKSATISFHCDRDPGVGSASISFIGTDPDECAYFFEARSIHACAHAEPHKPGSVGPGGIFSLILIIAVLVYILGGVFYNRTISHSRGWRQLPNYSLWAGIWSFASVRPSQSKTDLPYR
ncbi:autophagy-related protein 27 domain-containing protein [Sarocladium implicatum]|nr:autophagy-related protein 27 domain-containing protein [Sarocladium implicatum]